MRAYSQDLRERIVDALVAHEESQAEIAERFAVSLPFIEQLWRRWRTTGHPSVSTKTMCLELKRLRLPLKKSRSRPASATRPG